MTTLATPPDTAPLDDTPAVPDRAPRRKVGRWILFAVMLAIAAVMLYPFWVMIFTSLKSEQQFLSGGGFSWLSWRDLTSVIPIGQEILSSTIVCSASILVILVVGLPAGFAFSKLRFRASTAVFLIMVSAMMVPLQAILMPEFVNVTRLHLTGGYLGACLLYTSQQFEKGKAAMLVDGTWDTAQYTGAMGTNVAAFVPPYSNTPIKGVVEYPGDGFSVTKFSKHKTQAFEFLDFLTTTQAGNIINKAGLIPDIAGLKTTNPVNQEMLNFVTQDHMTAYPMMDNYVQVNVGNAADKELPAVLANQESPKAALQNMQQAWQQLPAAQRSTKDFAG